VWVAINDEIPIALNSPSLDKLMERVTLAIPEMLAMNGKPGLTANCNHEPHERHEQML
jgi:hypothetical protein